MTTETYAKPFHVRSLERTWWRFLIQHRRDIRRGDRAVRDRGDRLAARLQAAYDRHDVPEAERMHL